MKNILVTGATGCLGSNLTAELVSQGYTVRLFRRQSSNLLAVSDIDAEHVVGDIRDVNSLKRALKGCDTVFHVAAMVSYWKRERAEMYDINIGGTANVVKACLQTNVEKLVHTSSIAAIGYAGNGIMADEDTEFSWEPYDVGYRISKFRAEAEIRKGIALGLPAVIVNPSVIVGERDIHFHGGQIIRDVFLRRIFYYIRGGTSVVYAGDVVRGHIEAALRGRAGERYILSGENLTHREIISTAAEVVGAPSPAIELPMALARGIAWSSEIAADLRGSKPWIGRELLAGLDLQCWFSCAKAARELDYSVTPYRTAAERAFAWYRQNNLLAG